LGSNRIALGGERGIGSCFLQGNLRVSQTNALQKSSVTAKTVGDYRFLTLFQIPLFKLITTRKKGYRLIVLFSWRRKRDLNPRCAYHTLLP